MTWRVRAGDWGAPGYLKWVTPQDTRVLPQLACSLSNVPDPFVPQFPYVCATKVGLNPQMIFLL